MTKILPVFFLVTGLAALPAMAQEETETFDLKAAYMGADEITYQTQRGGFRVNFLHEDTSKNASVYVECDDPNLDQLNRQHVKLALDAALQRREFLSDSLADVQDAFMGHCGLEY